MAKKTQYTTITPIPHNIPRQLAIQLLHSHGEIIELNPLVTGHRPIATPRDSPADEFFAQWHEIDEIMTWGFGMKKKISFKGVFHDMPWGLQTHTYAPFGVDLRYKWQIKGNQPGEPREPKELGLEVPSDGLYLREDVEITCNVALTGFVKKEMKQAAATMVERLKRKAELLDEGVLQAMFEDGKLKTVNPAQHAHLANANAAMQSRSTGLASNSSLSLSPPCSPALTEKNLETHAAGSRFGNYHEVARQESMRGSHYLASRSSDSNSRRASQYSGHQVTMPSVPEQNFIAEVEGNYYHPVNANQGLGVKYAGPTFAAELPGDDQYLTPRPLSMAQGGEVKQNPYGTPPPSNQMHPTQRYSAADYPQPSPTPSQRQRMEAESRASQPTISPRPSPAQPQTQFAQPQPSPVPQIQPYNPQEHAAREHRSSSASQRGYQPHQITPPMQNENRFSTGALRDSLPPPPPNPPSAPTPALAQAQSPPPSQMQSPPPSQVHSPPPSQMQSPPPSQIHSPPPSQMQTPPQTVNPRLSSSSFDKGDDSHPDALRPGRKGSAPAGSNVWCPVCKNFQGDEAAVSHHVSTHFN